MDDLATWLRAQLDDDERIARTAASDGPDWRYSDSGIYPSDESRHPGPIIVGPYGYLMEEHGDHIARHDPARVLSEVDAKRRILDEHAPEEHPAGMRCSVCAEGPYYDATWYDAPCPTVRLLALPYADRPGYRDEWRPEVTDGQ